MSGFNKVFSYQAGGQVWRLMLNQTGILVVEERTPDKEVSFTVITIAGGSVLHRLRGPHTGWCGIETVTNKLLLLHGYAKPDMPAHNGIYAYSLTTGSRVWQAEDCMFLFESNGDVFAAKQQFEGKEYFVLDAETGSLKAELGSNAAVVNAARALRTEQVSGYVFSSVCAAGEPGGVPVELAGPLAEVPNGSRIEYITHNGFLFFAWHRQNPDGSYDQLFTAAYGNSVLHSACINKGITRLMPDSFFIKDGYLLLLERKDTVTVFRIGN